MEVTKNDRIVWVDNLRALACIFVVLIHVIDGWLKDNNNNTVLEIYTCRWFLDNVLLQVFIRTTIPIFVMISGMLLLNPDKELNFRKICKYIKRMILVLFTFGLAYCFIEQIFINKFESPLNIIFNSILNVFQNKSWGMMWYIYMLIGLYLITPFMKNALKNMDNVDLKFIICVLFIIDLLIPTLNYLLKIQISDLYLGNNAFLFYYLMGYVLKYKKDFLPKELKMHLIGLIGMVRKSSIISA